jgi:chemotaxis signal transduction protein
MTRRRAAELSTLPSEVRDLLVRRAERIRRPETEKAAEEDAMWIASFSLGDNDYAIPLKALRAAVPVSGVTPVPCSSRVVVGVLQFQSEIIAALSTAALLGSGWSVDPMILLVVDAGRGQTIALDCAQIPLATTVPLSQYREAVAAAIAGAFPSVLVPGRRPVTVINIEQLLDKQDWGGLNA